MTDKKTLTDADLVAILEDVKGQPHPDTWSVCGQREVVAIVEELQASRAAIMRVVIVLDRFGLHHRVVKIARAALVNDAEFSQFWRP